MNINITDEQLMIRIGGGDRTAYKILVDRHLRPYLVFAARVIQDRAGAEDIMQEAFVRVWKNASKWDQGRKTRFTTWFYRVVMNLCIDAKRKYKPAVDQHSNSSGSGICVCDMRRPGAGRDTPDNQAHGGH